MKRALIPATILLFAANGAIAIRVFVGGVTLAEMHPRVEYLIDLPIHMDPHGERAVARFYLPQSGDTQTVREEKFLSSGLTYGIVREDENRLVVWEARDLSTGEEVVAPAAPGGQGTRQGRFAGGNGHVTGVYNAIVHVRETHYRIPPDVPVSSVVPEEAARHLQPTDAIQSDDPLILETARGLVEGLPSKDALSILRALYDFVHDEVANSDYENTLDAVTTLKWKEAFCGGKSRLLAALLRSQGIPARMVGGLILAPGTKRTTHAWVEAYVNGVWVPFDPLNSHFAERPARYLVLYRGDHVLTRYTKNVNFRYDFHIKKWRTPPDEMMSRAGASGLFNTYVFWDAFRRAGVSLNLLRILLVLPAGALVVILLRNVVGLTTFGTFMPALLAVAFRDTGLLWGLILFAGVLGTGAVLRIALDRIQMLHTPRLGILLVFIVSYMLAVAYFSVEHGVLEAARVSMFPIVLLAITVERFFLTTQERGLAESGKVILGSFLAVVSAYFVMDSHFVQAVIFVFPEVILAVVAVYLILGRYVGIRLLEIWRFRWLVIGEGGRA